MCFSATASFIAGSSLIILGAATISKVESKAELPFVIIPLLFGIQQLTEGVLWLTFAHEAYGIQQTMAYVFTGFSHVVWPIYVPLAILALETVDWRKKVILGFEVGGICVSTYLLYFISTDGVIPKAIGHHIVYTSPHLNPFVALVFYVLATCVSCFFSSHVYIKIFGGLSLLGFAAAYIISEVAAFSIWCFFAGIISFFILFHFNFNFRKCRIQISE